MKLAAYIPSVAFNKFRHVTIISRKENITSSGYNEIECSHLRRMVLKLAQRF